MNKFCNLNNISSLVLFGHSFLSPLYHGGGEVIPQAFCLLGHTLVHRLDVATVVTLPELGCFIAKFSGITFCLSSSLVSVSLSPREVHLHVSREGLVR